MLWLIAAWVVCGVAIIILAWIYGPGAEDKITLGDAAIVLFIASMGPVSLMIFGLGEACELIGRWQPWNIVLWRRNRKEKP